MRFRRVLRGIGTGDWFGNSKRVFRYDVVGESRHESQAAERTAYDDGVDDAFPLYDGAAFELPHKPFEKSGRLAAIRCHDVWTEIEIARLHRRCFCFIHHLAVHHKRFRFGDGSFINFSRLDSFEVLHCRGDYSHCSNSVEIVKGITTPQSNESSAAPSPDSPTLAIGIQARRSSHRATPRRD